MPADVEAAVYDRLANDPDIAAAVGGRIFPEVVPADKPFPAVAYMMVQRTFGQNLDGPNGLSAARFAITVCAMKEADCEPLMDKVLPLFHRSQGVWAGVSVLSSIAATSSDDYEPPAHASDDLYYMLTQEIVVNHRV